jgi:hypothetical protein
MPFAKHGIVTVSTVKCSCGCTLQSVATQCPDCGKNLRPLTNPDDKAQKKKSSKKEVKQS